MTDHANRLLIVDDEPEIRTFFRDVAEDLGFAVAEAGDAVTFARAYDELRPTVILLDLTMPETDGVELLRNLANRDCAAPVLLASGQDERVLSTAARLGRMLGLDMREGLRKPVSVLDLEEALRAAARNAGPAPSATMLKQAIAAGELLLHYQPKVGLNAREGRFPIIGCEALARWVAPERGLILPGAFIPLAEESGLIGDLSDVLLSQVIDQLCAWRADGLALPVSFNLSPSQLTDLTLPDRVAARLAEADIDPRLLVVEITEQAAMADLKAATDILTRLRIKNIAVSLDDFGAGYSSLAEIYRLPLSELKIDRSLVVDLDRDEDARTVLRALSALARELNLSVCVEGVETAETADFLQKAGFEKAQGFYFGRPMPADDLRRLVQSQTGDTIGQTA